MIASSLSRLRTHIGLRLASRTHKRTHVSSHKATSMDYNYTLPEELIAKEPVTPRDSSRLFIYNTKTNSVTFDTFSNLAEHLPKKSFLVFNDTKVVPARVQGKKNGRKEMEILFLTNEPRPISTQVKGIVNEKLVVGDSVRITKDVSLKVVGQEEQVFIFETDMSQEKFLSFLHAYGTTPIPPYLAPSPLPEEVLRERYQSILAKHGASIAAPTASLHFTDSVLKELEAKHVPRRFITLNVGMGTFAPVTEEQITKKALHEEHIHLSGHEARLMRALRQQGSSLVAVGTTVARALESSQLESGDKTTSLFIQPSYHFTQVDALLTNFHLPESSLMMLVDAFLINKGANQNILDLYHLAIKEKFRFYSFGDAMLIV